VSSSGEGAKTLDEIHLANAVPERDLVVGVDKLGPTDGVRAGDLALVRVMPAARAGSAPVESAVILIDTSASRALGFESQLALVERIIAKLDPGTPLSVAGFDQGLDVIYQGPASGYAEVGSKRLRQRQAFGASDLQEALELAKNEAAKAGAKRVVLVTDGVATKGATELAPLRAAALALGKAGVRRLDVVAVGGIRNDALLRALVTVGLGRDGVVIDGANGAAEAAHRLSSATSSISVKIEGASWQWPERLDGFQPGDEALVYVRAAGPIKVRLGDEAAPDPILVEVDRPLLERAWATAKIAQLSAAPAAGRDAAKVKQEIVSLSTRHRVLSRHTALLVLESEQDYARYQIDRKALADILTVEGTELVRRKRGDTLVFGEDLPVKGKAAPRSDGVVLQAPPAPPGQAEPTGPPASPSDEREQAKADEEPASEAAPALASAAAMEPDGLPAARRSARRAPQPAATSMAQDPAPEELSPRDWDYPQRSRIGRRVDPSASPRGGRPPAAKLSPYEGPMAEVMEALEKGDVDVALAKAVAFRDKSPGDVMALVALGEALEAKGQIRSAARSYGSIIDLFSSRADLRRMAGQRLERLATPFAASLAADSYAQAVRQRPDHPAGHRLLAYARLRTGDVVGAFDAIEAGLRRGYPEGRFAAARKILGDDMGLIGAAWVKQDPSKRDEVVRRLGARGLAFDDKPSLRFVLVWETDANDVDFHIRDAKDGHAFYGHKSLPSGGELYADVTTGYGPECFMIPLPASERSGPYTLQAHYYSRGPMGYGMGKLQIIDHDGKGGLSFEERPFVVMRDSAFVDLGAYPAAKN
jgi:hypothetical protein